MIEALLVGLSTGAVMSVMLGTVFFALIQNSIDNGFRSGMMISLGVILSDVVLISLASIFSKSVIPEGGTTENIIRIAGALFLLAYGISNLTKKQVIAYPTSTAGRVFKFISTGFLLNFLNPGNFIGWLAISTQINQVAHYSTYQSTIFYTGALLAIFSTETLISVSAVSLKKYISARFLRYLDRIIGVLFLIFAVVLIFPVFFSRPGS